jgi:hypothetical protein
LTRVSLMACVSLIASPLLAGERSLIERSGDAAALLW